VIYYELAPVDTLFFRGAIPLEAGLPVSDSLFPPPLSVLRGAVLTASGPEFWQEARQVGVLAFLLKKGGVYYAQAPYSWFESKKDKHLVKARDNSAALSADGAAASAWPLPWIDCDDAKSLGGRWIDARLFSQVRLSSLPDEEPLFDSENRVGVGLDPKTRTAAESQLYTAQHIRLREDVSMVAALDGQYGLKESGVLQVGGERRQCWYRKLAEEPPVNMSGQGEFFVSFAPIKCTPALLEKAFCAKTYTAAGWDLLKGGHKETETYFCAGSVFRENINGQCAALAQ